MPLYDYRCKDCGHEFEAQQAFTDDALTECPSCGGTLRKLYNAVGIVFKGSGFYRTDSRSGSTSSLSAGSSGSSSSSDSSGPSTSPSTAPSTSSTASPASSAASKSTSE